MTIGWIALGVLAVLVVVAVCVVVIGIKVVNWLATLPTGPVDVSPGNLPRTRTAEPRPVDATEDEVWE